MGTDLQQRLLHVDSSHQHAKDVNNSRRRKAQKHFTKKLAGSYIGAICLEGPHPSC